MTGRVTVADIFAGCGGGSIGFQRAGFDVVGAVEIDGDAAAAYVANVGVEPLRRDIREVAGRDLLEGTGVGIGELTLLFGCPPCQSFTILRRGAAESAVDGVRNSLPRTGFSTGLIPPSQDWKMSSAACACTRLTEVALARKFIHLIHSPFKDRQNGLKRTMDGYAYAQHCGTRSRLSRSRLMSASLVSLPNMAGSAWISARFPSGIPLQPAAELCSTSIQEIPIASQPTGMVRSA